MAVYFTLTSKHTGERESFSSVDERICDHFGWNVDPKFYAHGWYDCIGLAIALGYDWPKIRQIYHADMALLDIATFLEENYDKDHWMGR